MNIIAVAVLACSVGNIFSPVGSCTIEPELDKGRCLKSHYSTYYVRSLDKNGREVMVLEQYLICGMYEYPEGKPALMAMK